MYVAYWASHSHGWHHFFVPMMPDYAAALAEGTECIWIVPGTITE